MNADTLSQAAESAFHKIKLHYTLSPDGELILLGALRSYDRYNEARAIVNAEGLTVTDSRGSLKAHPACSIEAASYKNFLAGMRFLSLDAIAEELAKA
jgi:hypothetical protein